MLFPLTLECIILLDMSETVQPQPPDAKQRAKWRDQFERDGPFSVRTKLNAGGYGIGYRMQEAKLWLREEEKAGVDRVTLALVLAAVSLIVSIFALLKD